MANKGFMNKIFKIVLSVFFLAVLFSFLPVVSLYLEKDPALYSNADAVKKIEHADEPVLKFIVLGDIHAGLIFNDSMAIKMAGSINKESMFRKGRISFVAAMGDVTFRGSEWDWRIFNKIRSRIKWPVISLMGNHDDDKDDGSLFKKYAGEKEFSFVVGNSYFIVLDNSSGEFTDDQFKFIEGELEKASGSSGIFIFMHKSPISPYQQSWYRPELNPWAYKFMKLCEKYNVKMVFSGHEHMFKSQHFGGVKYITSGAGGQLTHFPSYDGGFSHYVVVRVYGDYVDYEVRRIFPPLWEYLTYYLWKDLFYALKSVLL